MEDFTDKWFYAALGLETEEECKLCGSLLMANDLGDKWCSGPKCSWANNEMLIEFKQGLIDAIKGDVMLEYDIVIEESIAKLKQEVNQWLQDGWKPQGGVVIENFIDEEYECWYYQAVIKEYDATPKS